MTEKKEQSKHGKKLLKKKTSNNNPPKISYEHQGFCLINRVTAPPICVNKTVKQLSNNVQMAK